MSAPLHLHSSSSTMTPRGRRGARTARVGSPAETGRRARPFTESREDKESEKDSPRGSRGLESGMGRRVQRVPTPSSWEAYRGRGSLWRLRVPGSRVASGASGKGCGHRRRRDPDGGARAGGRYRRGPTLSGGPRLGATDAPGT